MKILALIGFLGVCLFAFGIYVKNNKQVVENYDKNGRSRMSSHLENVDKMARSLEHFDENFDENFDDFETEAFEGEYMEAVEHYKKRLTPESARRAAYQKMASKHGTQKTNRMVSKISKGHSTSTIGKNPFYDAAAQFDLTITRDTANIAMALTVPLFASVHYNAKYMSVMGNYLPNGVSIQSIGVNAKGDVVFTMVYSVTGATDTITVACTQVPYITFLSALNYNAMKLNKVRYAISDVTKLTQFSQPFEVYTKTIFGKHNGNGVSLAAVNNPQWQKEGVRDLDNAIDIDNSTAVVIGMINVAGFSVTLSSFVQTYNRISAHR